MTEEQIPLFIPLENFPEHCKNIRKCNLAPLIDLIHEMERKFSHAEMQYGITDFKDISFEKLDFKGIHVRLINGLLKLRFVPLFDWKLWKKEAEYYYRHPIEMYGLDTVTLGKIITVLLRSQTLYDQKFLQNKIKDKFVLHLLKAIVKSLENNDGSNYPI